MCHNPVACAGALAVIDYMETENLLSNSKEVGAYLLGRLGELLSFDIVGDVRGLGLMCGLELVKDKRTKEPFPPAAQAGTVFTRETMKRGLILYPCTGCVEGVAGDMILITPPLIVTRRQVDDMIAIMKEAMEATQEVLAGQER
jgi:adenosylmethionine-8-amino-7-oxononanoate aminotransferase